VFVALAILRDVELRGCSCLRSMAAKSVYAG